MRHFISIVESSLFVGGINEDKNDNKYQQGHCDAFAMAMLDWFNDAEIVTLHALHNREDGTSHHDEDFVHAFVRLGDGRTLDSKGFRSQEEIENDFSNYLTILKRSDDKSVTFIEKVWSDTEDFVDGCGVNPDLKRIADASDYAETKGIV